MTPDLTRTAPPAGTPTVSLVGDAPTSTGPPVLDTPTADGDFAPPVPTFDAPPGFVIERELALGGMGVVYLARQVGLNRPCALKLVKRATDPKALIRFLAEAEVVAAIRHPNVVEVFQYGEQQGQPYLALEYCPGGDLTRLVSPTRKRGTGEPSEATKPVTRDAAWFRRVAELMAGIADGVNAAHLLGIVHRDLKPHNVLLAADGSPKVADFGLAKRGGGSDLTQTDAVMGTPAYMSPEQAGGGTKFVGPEADVWALGVMLYELCCGERPIPLDSAVPLRDALARIIQADVAPLRTKCPTVPTDLALIAHKCLSKDPRDRYPTAGGLASDLRNWLDGKPISARPVGAIEQAVKWAKRNKKLAAMGAAVLLTMAVATGVSLGFGLEANEQRKTAVAAVKTANDEKQAAIDARVDLATANEKMERSLARAILGPITPNVDVFQAAFLQPLNEFERDAIWDLAEAHGGRVGVLFLEEATRSETTSWRLRTRAEFLFHATVGLDPSRRRDVDAWVAARLRDPALPRDMKTNLAWSVEADERLRDTRSDITDVVLEHLNIAIAQLDSGEMPSELARVAAQLPPEKAAAVCSRAVDELLACLENDKHWPYAYHCADGMNGLAPFLPPEKATAVCSRAVSRLLELLTAAQHETPPVRTGLRFEAASGIADLARHLPPGEAQERCESAVAVLTSPLPDDADTAGVVRVCGEVTRLAARLPAEKVAEVCGPSLEKCLRAIGRVPPEAGYDGIAGVLGQMAAVMPAGSVEAKLLARKDAAGAEEKVAIEKVRQLVFDREPAGHTEPPSEAPPVTWHLLYRFKRTWMEDYRSVDADPEFEAALMTASNVDVSRFELVRPVGALAGCAAVHPEALLHPRPLSPQQLVDLLKHPFCVREARRAVLDALEFVYDRKFADLWDFVAFAEKEHPELDLLTPPKRPEKK